jgi:hypothetical protein
LHDNNAKEFYKTTLLSALKQYRNESANEYYRRFLMIVDSDRTETDLVAEYCRGLKTKLKIYINTGEPPSRLSDAVRLAAKYEDLLQEQDGAEEIRPKMHRFDSITEEDGLSSTLIETLNTLGDTNTHMKDGIMKELDQIIKKLDEPKQLSQQPQPLQQQQHSRSSTSPLFGASWTMRRLRGNRGSRPQTSTSWSVSRTKPSAPSQDS